MDVECSSGPLDDLINCLLTDLLFLFGVDYFAVHKIDSAFVVAIFYSYAAGVFVLSLELDDIRKGETNYFALETMYEANYEFDSDEMVVLINIGASATGINVVKGGMSIFTRDFALAGNSITESLQEKYKVTFEEAEKIKIDGIPDGSDGDNLDLKNSILDFAQPICSEIERSIDYFRSTFGGEYIKHVLLAGGSAGIYNLTKNLSEKLNVKTEIINPFFKIGYNKRKIDVNKLESIKPVAATAIGLGLRKMGDK